MVADYKQITIMEVFESELSMLQKQQNMILGANLNLYIKSVLI